MNKDEQKGDSEPVAIAKYGGIAFQMIAIIGVFTYVGYKIDESARHTTKWVTAILSLIGVFIAMYVIFKSLKK